MRVLESRHGTGTLPLSKMSARGSSGDVRMEVHLFSPLTDASPLGVKATKVRYICDSRDAWGQSPRGVSGITIIVCTVLPVGAFGVER